jgi:hypothetical protein
VPQSEVERSALVLYQSRVFPDVKSSAQALVKIKLGRQLGLDDASAMMGLFISSQGKLTMSANLMGRLIKTYRGEDGRPKYRYSFREKTARACEIELFERVSGEWESQGTERVALDDFKFLMVGPNKANWANYPKNMLVARCLSNVARFYCPDAFGGSPVYLPDEVPTPGVKVDPETLEAVATDDGGEAPRAEIQGAFECPEAARLHDLLRAAGKTLVQAEEHLGARIDLASPEQVRKVVSLLEPVVGLRAG